MSVYNVLGPGVKISNPSFGGPLSEYRICTNWYEAAQKHLSGTKVNGQEIANRRSLYFPAGYAYQLPQNKTLEFTEEEQSIIGEGPGSLIFRAGPSKQPLIRIKNTKLTTIRNLTLKAGEKSSLLSACIDIIGATQSVNIENVRCFNARTGIKLREGQGIHIVSCELYDCIHNIELGDPGTNAMIKPLLQDVLISNCIIRDALVPTTLLFSKDYATGIDFRGKCVDIVIDGNVIKGSRNSGITLFGPVDRILFSNNEIHDNENNGVEIKQGRNLVFEGNLLAKNKGCGVKIYPLSGSSSSKTSNISFTGNQIIDNNLDGIDNQAEYVLVVGNMFTNNGISMEGNYGGIRFHGADSNNMLQNGIITNNIISKNRYSNDSNVGIQCINTKYIQIGSNIISYAIDTINRPHNRTVREGRAMGVYLKNSDSILLTGNTFEGYTEEDEGWMPSRTPPLKADNSTYTAANNTGLQNRTALEHASNLSRDTHRRGMTKLGELIYKLNENKLMYMDKDKKWYTLAEYEG